MPLPLNSSRAKQAGCAPMSSNCIVWQGRDLPCISLCKGDTITDVVEKLADELCDLMDMFDLDNYDLSCFNNEVPQIKTFDELIQKILDKICDLEDITPGGGTITPSTCPEDCIVDIATCFYFENETGDTVTTMSLTDYITAIGNKLCKLIDDVTGLTISVEQLQDDVTAIDSRVDTIEATYVKDPDLDYTNTATLDPSLTPRFVTLGVKTIEDAFVAHMNAVGLTTKIYQSMFKGVELADLDALSRTGTYQGLSGWITTMTSLSDSYNNMWIVIKDLRDAVDYLQKNNSLNACGLIKYNFRTELDVSDPSNPTVVFYLDGSQGLTPYRDSDSSGASFTITDSDGNSTTAKLNIISTAANPAGYSYNLAPTSVDETKDLTIELSALLYNPSTNTTCEHLLHSVIRIQDPCTGVTLTPGSTSIEYEVTILSGYTYIVDLYEESGIVAIQSMTINTASPTFTGTFTGLTASTDYEVQVSAVDDEGIRTTCSRLPVTTTA